MKRTAHKKKSAEVVEYDEMPPVAFDTVDDTPKEAPTKKSNFFLYLLLGIAIIVAGNLYSKVRVLEGTTAKAPTEQAGTPGATKKPEVLATDPVLGNKNAPVTMIIYEDYQCPYCGAFTGTNQKMVENMKSRDPNWEPTVTNVIKDYVNTGKVKLVWKDYPFLGPESYSAAEAARCAQDQGKFWEYHDYLFTHQGGENQGAFSKESLKKYAQELGLNTQTFDTCFDSGKYTKQMQEAQAQGQEVGVSGTPGVFVNGEFTSGAASYTQFKDQIEKSLKG